MKIHERKFGLPGGHGYGDNIGDGKSDSGNGVGTGTVNLGMRWGCGGNGDRLVYRVILYVMVLLCPQCTVEVVTG